MSEVANDIIMNRDAAEDMLKQAPQSTEEIRLERKQKLAAALRLFGKFGFDEGVAGHITVRDPEQTDCFWVNPMGKSFKLMKVSDLLLVNHKGEIVEGEGLLNGAAFTWVGKAIPRVITSEGSIWCYLPEQYDLVEISSVGEELQRKAFDKELVWNENGNEVQNIFWSSADNSLSRIVDSGFTEPNFPPIEFNSNYFSLNLGFAINKSTFA